MTKIPLLNHFGAVCTSTQKLKKELAVVAILILSIFRTTVMCQRSFSALHFIKNKYRNKLTNDNLEATLRLALEERSVIEFPFGKVL
jgi:hypothetical protein